MARKKKEPEAASNEWMGTYGDMITLMLCFFVMLYNPTEETDAILAQIAAYFSGPQAGGGVSLSAGTMADMGNTFSALPSLQKGTAMGQVYERAMSLLVPDVKSNRITVTSDERAVVISLAGDLFFAPDSSVLNIDATRETLIRLAQFLALSEMDDRRFRIEGHTDKRDWELSSARATTVLHYLADYGVDEAQFSVAGYADTQPKYSNDTAEGRAYNRRVDIVILDDAHF
jgi:chemotaxis protein MotB